VVNLYETTAWRPPSSRPTHTREIEKIVTTPISTAESTKAPKIQLLQVRFLAPGNQTSCTKHLCAPAEKVFTEDRVQLILGNRARELKDRFPGGTVRGHGTALADLPRTRIELRAQANFVYDHLQPTRKH